MKYVIASIGRSGSTLIANLLFQATGAPVQFSSDLNSPGDGIFKTHIHFKSEPKCGYKAIFIYSKDITDVICSMYAGRVDMKRHLFHLEVFRRHRLFFKAVTKIRRLFSNEKIDEALIKLAFRYMIANDKFRFMENALSWKASKNVLFVVYEDLCESKDRELLKISNFLGIRLPDFEVKERQARRDNIPADLIELSIKEYGDFFQTLANR
jgi:hypothetical protein